MTISLIVAVLINFKCLNFNSFEVAIVLTLEEPCFMKHPGEPVMLSKATF